MHFTFHIVSGVTYMWAVILFPDGRLPPQIRIGRRAQAACAAGFTALVAVLCWRSSFLAHPQFFVIFFGIAVPVVGIAAQVLRLRDPQTTTNERRVARMLCAALLPAFATALLWLACRLVAALTSGATHVDAVHATVRIATWFPVVFAVVPVVLFAAVLRYRLWDVDRWLTRVLVYGVLTVAIAIGYVVGVLIGASLFGPDTLWTMVLTLAVVAALVEPARVWLRRWANRVVFGVSLDPQEALRTLSKGLDRLTPAEELDRLTSVALNATRANAVRLWLIDGDDVLCTAAAPPDASRDPVTIVDLGLREGVSFAAVADALGETVCCPVRHQGELLGLLGASTTDGIGDASGRIERCSRTSPTTPACSSTTRCSRSAWPGMPTGSPQRRGDFAGSVVGWSRRRTRSGAGSSAICTTAPSRRWSLRSSTSGGSTPRSLSRWLAGPSPWPRIR